MEKHSKRYRAAIKVADLTKDYSLADAVEILAKFPKAKFDETVELSFRLGVDPRGDESPHETAPAKSISRRPRCPCCGQFRRSP